MPALGDIEKEYSHFCCQGAECSKRLSTSEFPRSALHVSALVITFKYILLLGFTFFLFGCSTSANHGRFELKLHSSFFGDISVIQGKMGTATVSIDREIDSPKFASTINMSLIDPPSWLAYQFEINPVKGNSNTIKLNIDENAKPGIYRLTLHGVGNTTGSVVEDSVTFHLKIVAPESESENKQNSAMFNLKEKLFELLNLNKSAEASAPAHAPCLLPCRQIAV